MKTPSIHGMHGMLGQGMEDESVHQTMRIVYGILLLWFLAAAIGGMRGIFNQPGVPPAGVGLFLVVPIGGFVLAYAAIPRLRQALDLIPLWLITIAHTWRFVGLGFVIGALANILPRQFGYPEGVGDVLTAALCLPLAAALRNPVEGRYLRRAFIAWNLFGLVDLLSAITMGILYSPSTFGVLRTGLSTALMTRFPVNLIPTFFLPLFILLHLLSLRRSRELI
jgi:hypothetical protein